MYSASDQQHSGQNQASTTMWSQPQTAEQKRYYSKHSPKRKVYGWIMTLLQTAHGFLAFAAWTAVYVWVFTSIPQFAWLATVLSITTLFALHILFRTTWETFWYDRLDDDPQTDSSVFMPIAILALLLFAEINGASMYLTQQVKPVEVVETKNIDDQHATTLTSLNRIYQNEKAEIEALYKTKLKSATTVVDAQIRRARINGDKTGPLNAKRAQLIAPIEAQKTAALEAAFAKYNNGATTETDRRGKSVAQVDQLNEQEQNRYLTELGNVGTYAWVLSVALLALISGLGYARVRINVKSGILPLRNYTVLDAHGSVVERFATAFGDIFNRRSLQLAVWIHRIFSPKKELTSFDGTVVAKPGTYNSPAGSFRDVQQAHDNPQATDPDAVLRTKVANKIMRAAEKGEVVITPELINLEYAKAKAQNGTYNDSPLGKTEPSPMKPAQAEGNYPTAERVPSNVKTDAFTFDSLIKSWASRVITQVKGYDNAILSNNPEQAAKHQNYINSQDGPIRKEAFRLDIDFGVDQNHPEIMVWMKSNPSNKVPISKVSEKALLSPISKGNGQPEAGDSESLFKQKLTLFKQRIEAQRDDKGTVIGVKYQKVGGDWIVYAKPQVEAFVRRYSDRDREKRSEATTLGLKMWQYALSLFTETAQPANNKMEAIHL